MNMRAYGYAGGKKTMTDAEQREAARNLQINGRGEEEKMRMEDHIGLIFCQTFLEWRM